MTQTSRTPDSRYSALAAVFRELEKLLVGDGSGWSHEVACRHILPPGRLLDGDGQAGDTEPANVWNGWNTEPKGSVRTL